ncbi:hypothetical protein NORO109296_26750 [Nocardiopsis rhodophaea]
MRDTVLRAMARHSREVASLWMLAMTAPVRFSSTRWKSMSTASLAAFQDWPLTGTGAVRSGAVATTLSSRDRTVRKNALSARSSKIARSLSLRSGVIWEYR